MVEIFGIFLPQNETPSVFDLKKKRSPISKLIINYSGDMAFPCQSTSFMYALLVENLQI